MANITYLQSIKFGQRTSHLDPFKEVTALGGHTDILDEVVKQTNRPPLTLELSNLPYITLPVGSVKLLANLFGVLPYNKGLSAEVSNMAKTTQPTSLPLLC